MHGISKSSFTCAGKEAAGPPTEHGLGEIATIVVYRDIGRKKIGCRRKKPLDRVHKSIRHAGGIGLARALKDGCIPHYCRCDISRVICDAGDPMAGRGGRQTVERRDRPTVERRGGIVTPVRVYERVLPTTTLPPNDGINQQGLPAMTLTPRSETVFHVCPYCRLVHAKCDMTTPSIACATCKGILLSTYARSRVCAAI